jgi:hypothetical protein
MVDPSHFSWEGFIIVRIRVYPSLFLPKCLSLYG